MEPPASESPVADESGATATEYAIMLGFIALAIVGGVTAFGIYLNDYYNAAAASLRTLLGLG